MKDIFPAPVLHLPQADIPLDGVEAYLSQGSGHQIIFMQFSKDVALPEHDHAGQWGVVLHGKIELTIGGVTGVYEKGDRYYIPEGVKHSGKIYAGYADMTFFDQEDRYTAKG
jgi:quercetin dioxygenase-like cupin family protein